MPDWVTAAPVGALAEGEMIAVTLDDRDVALYCKGGRYYATDNLCTHGLAMLTDGFLDEMEIECPLHGGRFDIQTGKGLGEPITCDIRAYPVRVENAQIQILIEVTENAGS